MAFKSGCYLLMGLLLLAQTLAFQFPDISSIFSSFREKMTSQEEEVLTRAKRSSGGDESTLPYEIKTSGLPMRDGKINQRYMPTLGNGHIATTVFHDSFFLNGLYNGAGGESHRARIPARIMSRIRISNDDVEKRATRKYILNAEEGFFKETIDCDFALIEHTIYAHKHFIRLLVSTISWRKKTGLGGLGGGKLILQYPSFNISDDITFDTTRAYYAHFHTSGTTKVKENEAADTRQVHIFWMDPLTQIAIQGGGDQGSYTVIMSADLHESDARSDFNEALRVLDSGIDGQTRLFDLHSNAWKEVWYKGFVEIEGDGLLSKLTRFSQYYILSSLPSPDAYQPAKHSDFLYGVGRGSLSKGSAGRDYQGHVMWDSEMYILPAVVLFQPELTRRMLRYRKEMGAQAELIAESMGAKGYKFPFRSAYTGAEVSPSDCPECERKKYHVSAAVSWGIRQYYSATRDSFFLIDDDYRGCDVSREIARFYASVSEYDPETGRYNIKDMTGPDETYPGRNNNAYTLAAASLAIHWARYMACECQRNEREEVPDQWIQIALYLNLPFDNVRRLHDQFDGFNKLSSPRISQADTIMLTYPLNWNMSRDIMRQDLEYYEQITNDNIPAMTWSFFTVGWKWVDDMPRMNSFFLKSYKDYLVEPFKIWTELPESSNADEDSGNVNFLPGMGGYLQSIIYGFAGIRIRPEMLEFHASKPPINTLIRLNGLKYLGTNMTIEIGDYAVYITVNEVGDYPLVLRRNRTSHVEEKLQRDTSIVIDKPEEGFFIYTNERSSCEHPRDHMYMPWGYSPFVESGNMHTVSLLLLLPALLWTLCLIS